MLPQNLADEQANATLEFVLLAGLFAGPILAANQGISQLHLRQISLDSIAETVARDFSLSGSSSQSDALLQQLSFDAGLNRNELSAAIDCEPVVICDSASRTVTVRLGYRTAKSVAKHLMSESGSMMPSTIGLLTVCLAAVLVGADLEAAQVFDQRANQLARFLAQEHFAEPELSASIALQQEATQLAKQFAFQGAEITQARLERPDGITVRARVCTKFDLPIRIFDLGRGAVACGESKMRLVL